MMDGTVLEIESCNSNVLRDISFSLRHQVFCEEKHFEEERAAKRECDAYDDMANHYLFKDAVSGKYVGGFRLLRSPSDTVANANFLSDTLRPSATGVNNEVSRFLLLKPYRCSAVLLQAFKLISDVLCGMDEHAYILVERKLGVSLKRAGYDINVASKPIRYRGERAVYVIYNGNRDRLSAKRVS